MRRKLATTIFFLACLTLSNCAVERHARPPVRLGAPRPALSLPESPLGGETQADDKGDVLPALFDGNAWERVLEKEVAVVADVLPELSDFSQSSRFGGANSAEPALIPGDSVRIDVAGEEELSFEFAVPGEGSVKYPLIGEIAVQGRTVSQLAREISGRLARFLVDPVLRVSVPRWRERKVYVYGASEKSRALPLSPEEPVTLSQLLVAMGVSRATTDLSAVTVIRPQADGKKEIVPVNLLRVFENFELDKDLVLRHNDLVVLQDNPRVYVQGEVGQKGAVSFSDSREMTLAKLLARVGPGSRADLEKIQIVRGKGKDAKTFQVSGVPGSGKQIRLDPEDVITVPVRAESFATVYGEVKRPGTVALPEGRPARISTVIALAGGTTEYASSTISLYRYSEKGDAQKFSLDFDEVAAGDPNHDVEVAPGDTLYIGASIW